MNRGDNLVNEINEVVNKVGDAWEAAFSALLKSPLSLDEISESYSKKTDKFILEVEKQEGIMFVAGKFFITHTARGNCVTHADLYFQNPRDESWVKKELKGNVLSENITEQSRNEIISVKLKEYDISPPGA